MASRTSLSLPCLESIVPFSDMPNSISTHPDNQKSSKTTLKIRFKFNPNHTSIDKVGVANSAVIGESEINLSSSSQKSTKISDDPFVSDMINGTQPSGVSDPSHKKSSRIKFRVKSSNTSIHSSIVKEGDVAEKSNACKGESSLVTSVDQHQPAVINVPEAAKKNGKKRQFFSVTLPREEIEEDIAAIEALSGGKRLRRPKKRDLPGSHADQRRIDRLFPGLEYLGFH